MNVAPYVTAVLALMMLGLIVMGILLTRAIQRMATAERDLRAARDSLASMTITEEVSVTASEPLPGWVEVRFAGEPVVMVCLRTATGAQHPAGRRFMQVIARLAAHPVQQG